MKILAFESSCDETAVAVVEDGRRVLSDAIASQADLHALYGGVVPEIASRKHVEAIAALTEKALADAGCTRRDIDAVAVTAQAEVTLDPAPRLTIAKSLCPAVITENGQLTYTFTLQNTGAAEAGAEAAIQITDLFDPILRDITVTLNGDAWPQAGNYTYDAATGLFSTAAGQITVPAATFVQDETTGVWTAVPGVTSLAVSGQI